MNDLKKILSQYGSCVEKWRTHAIATNEKNKIIKNSEYHHSPCSKYSTKEFFCTHLSAHCSSLTSLPKQRKNVLMIILNSAYKCKLTKYTQNDGMGFIWLHIHPLEYQFLAQIQPMNATKKRRIKRKATEKMYRIQGIERFWVSVLKWVAFVNFCRIGKQKMRISKA